MERVFGRPAVRWPQRGLAEAQKAAILICGADLLRRMASWRAGWLAALVFRDINRLRSHTPIAINPLGR